MIGSASTVLGDPTAPAFFMFKPTHLMKFLKQKGLILSLVFLPLFALGQTNVSGILTTNTTWTLTNSPYVLTGDVTVNPGVTLTIEAGVVVKFTTIFEELRIRGKISAVGTSSDSIVFTSYKDDAHGGDTNGDGAASTPAAQDWGRVFFETGSDPTSQFSFCLFSYGGWSNSGMLSLEESANVNNNLFWRGAGGLLLEENAAPSIQNNGFEELSGFPIYMTPSANPSFSTNSFSQNSFDAVNILSRNYDNATYTLKKPSGFGLPDWAYVITSFQNVRFRNNAILNIDPGVVIKMADGFSNLQIDGIGNFNGSATDSVIFTSLTDDSYGGDSNTDGSSSSPQGPEGGFVTVADGNLTYCRFRYMDARTTGALRISGNPTANHLEFFKNRIGLTLFDGSTPDIQNSVFDEMEVFPISLSLGSNPSFASNTFSNSNFNGIGILSETYNNDTFYLRKPSFYGLADQAYVIQSFQEVRVRDLGTLIIDPGVVIKTVDRFSRLRVEGVLDINGSAADPFVMTSIQDDVYGGDTNNDGATTTPQASSGGYLAVVDGNIEHGLFRYGDGSGNGMLQIAGNLQVDQCSFFQANVGINCASTSTPLIQNTDFDQMEVFPISLSLASFPSFNNNTFTNSTYNGIGINSETYQNDTFYLRSPTQFGLSNQAYVLRSFQEVRIRDLGTLIIDPGVVIKTVDRFSRLRVGGSIEGNGSPAQPIVVTVISDDAYGGDTNNDGTATTPQAGSGGYMSVVDGSIDQILFRYGDGSNAGMLQIFGNLNLSNATFFQNNIGVAAFSGSTPSISNSTFDQQDLLAVSLSLGTDPTFSNNTFTNNSLDAVGIISENYDNDTFYLRPPLLYGLPQQSYVLRSFQEVRLRSGARLEVLPGTIVKGTDRFSRIRIDGEAQIQGTDSQPIVFTSL